MSQIIPILIPTYISAADYAPARVLPRVFFYNGLIDCETYNIESGSLTKAGIVKPVSQFPYFDNYNVVTGSFPTQGSDSLLFTNEAVAYGQLPSGSLYSEYWETYITLLYNPRTRLVNCDAIIPLAEYFKMELNDIVQWRGNYYHLRAINDYNLSNGECKLQLLGPVIDDVISAIVPTTYCDFEFTSSVINPVTTTTLTPTTLVPTTTLTPTTLTPTTLTPTTIVPTTTSTTTTLVPTTTLTPLPGICYCITYDEFIGSLNVRYRALVGGVTTVAITSLESIDNGDGTFTACICVLQGDTYAVPVCVMDGIEVSCGSYVWVEGQQCNQETNCFITPTTTTTIPPCPDCIQYSIARVGGGDASYSYIDCYGVTRGESFASSVVRDICAREILSLTNATATARGNCGTVECGNTGSLDLCNCTNLTVDITGVNTRSIYWLECGGSPQEIQLSYFGITSNTACRVSGSLILPTNNGNPFTFPFTPTVCNTCPTTTTTI